MSDRFVRVPRELTAENGAKAALIGEFRESVEAPCAECIDAPEDDCPNCGGSGTVQGHVTVSWTTIKAIHKRVVELFSVAPSPPEDGLVEALRAEIASLDFSVSRLAAHERHQVLHDACLVQAERLRKILTTHGHGGGEGR